MAMEVTDVLSEEVICYIFSLMMPQDACKLSQVSRAFKSIADSDALWEKFLPHDYHKIISNAGSLSTTLLSLSKKNLYCFLCHYFILIDNHKISFALQKQTGKKSFVLGARALSIALGDTPTYWTWTSLPESRFPQVARLRYVWWFDVKGKIDTKFLSHKTNYAAYLLFKFAETRYGFHLRPVEMCVKSETSGDGQRRLVFLDPSEYMLNYCWYRGDGWWEIEMGEFFNEHGDDGMLECSLQEVDNFIAKSGMIIEGIELRPKEEVNI